MTGKLQGKVAIITGGNSGIGESTAHLFAEEGAKVAIMARREKEGRAVQQAIEAKGGTAEFIQCDVTITSDIEQAVKRTVDLFGSIDVLFNNAGGAGPERFPEESREHWDYVLAQNLNGVFDMCTSVWPYMVNGGGGSIVNMSSGAAVMAHTPFLKSILGRSPVPASYSVSKAGVDAFTRWAAGEGGEVNIRVNGVRPGQILTPLTDVDGKGEHALKPLFDMIQITPGTGYPEDVAKAVLFLACDDSKFVTGDFIHIDGGLPIKL